MSEREILAFEEALDRILDAVPEPEAESVALADAFGRVLARDVDASEDFPAHDNSAMDGFAVRASELRAGEELRLVGDAFAGRPFGEELPGGACVRVMTGGLIPRGADAVVPVELSSGYEPLGSGGIRFERVLEKGANIRPRGCVRRAGQRLLEAGSEIRPAGIGVLAQQGITRVQVARRPEVAIVPTGDEVVPIDRVPEPGQVRNSNAWALAAQVQAAGGVARIEDVLGDEREATTAQLRAALETSDLVCTIGGVSMGTKDLVRGSFEELGGRCHVESVRIKPGKPTYFGSVELGGRRRFLLGLPGNPASSFTIFTLFGEPFCRVFQGEAKGQFRERSEARLGETELRKNWRLQALPGRLWHGADGTLLEHVHEVNSADLFCLAEADAFFLVPPDEACGEGDVLSWVPVR